MNNIKIENNNGIVFFGFNDELNDEEGEHYIPEFYKGSVLELKFIQKSYGGNARQLMLAFLNHSAVIDAELIFLDCSPNYMVGNEVEIMQRLHDFYASFGFAGKHDNGYSRMWKVQVPMGWNEHYNEDNDCHVVLRDQS